MQRAIEGDRRNHQELETLNMSSASNPNCQPNANNQFEGNGVENPINGYQPLIAPNQGRNKFWIFEWVSIHPPWNSGVTMPGIQCQNAQCFKKLMTKLFWPISDFLWPCLPNYKVDDRPSDDASIRHEFRVSTGENRLWTRQNVILHVFYRHIILAVEIRYTCLTERIACCQCCYEEKLCYLHAVHEHILTSSNCWTLAYLVRVCLLYI